MQIREATVEDAPAACIVLKRSIAELCQADHRNDPSILARWLGNKTHENFCAWVEQTDNSVLVAVENQDILAVGSVTDAGTIGLNYVSPDARFRGVSRAMLHALEMRAAERGNNRCNLTSTETARQFYLFNGYLENGPPVGGFGTSSGYPMTKVLVKLVRAEAEAPSREKFELRRQSDDLVYRFHRQQRSDGSVGYKREDGDHWIVRKLDWGWISFDYATQSCMGRPWNVLPHEQGDFPPEGDWVSRKGAKSYVYTLAYLP
jgi:GNAT superfamily N-acetyltransferase